ncbi:MAG: RHS repeat domain-containing protein [Patescibacteria group bacterium]|nr:RHS repeat domain-containing protein [Patescibacteria group bacterium]
MPIANRKVRSDGGGDAGRMASAESGRYNNTVAFDYDAAGRLTSESLTITFGQTTTYTVQSAYDAANRRTGITYPDERKLLVASS